MVLPIEGIEDIKQASVSKQISDSAEFESQKKQVSAIINYGALAGQNSVLWMRPMSEDIKKFLESNGYKITEPEYLANKGDQYIISW